MDVEAQRAAVTFDPAQLVTARELQGYSQVDTARVVGDLTSASISQFENGHVRPSAGTLARLAEALEVPVRFFAARPPRAPLAGGHGNSSAGTTAFFRSLRSTAVSDRRRARALAQLLHLLVQELEQYVDLPIYDVPERPALAMSYIEPIAGEVRDGWELPPGPVDDVVRVLERHGIVTARFRVAAEKVDAFSIPYTDRPVVVLGADKGHRDRSRFDAAHELGHLVLHRKLEPGETALERQAHAFAAAFLMPADDIGDQLPRRPDWPRLLELKRTWHVSLAALLMRAKTLGVMSDAEYLKGIKAMSARGWRKEEPGELGAPETPRLLPAALKVATQAGLPLEEIAARAGLPLTMLKGILGPSINPRPSVTI